VARQAEPTEFGVAADANDQTLICIHWPIMPELPEVETMRRGVLGVVGARIEDVQRVPCRRKPIAVTPRIDRFRRRAAGRTIHAVDRVGKRVVLRLDSGAAIVIEPRMTGLVLVADPPDPSYLRFRCRLSGARVGELLYWDRRGLGSVRLFSSTEFDAAFGPDRLGPDALAISAEMLRQRLGSSRRAVKVALLDQRAVAGIGNLYASEILHAASIHPARRCDRMTSAQWQAVADAMHEVLEEAIRHEGSTLSDGTYRNALGGAGGYQDHHRVYGREGQPCRRCGSGALIHRIVQAQRSTFFCPACQMRRGALAPGH
jgi:formamidopyrimidine-DNA glycosylase